MTHAPRTPPTKVKIGFMDFAIETMHHHEASGDDRDGDTNMLRQRIRIDSSLSPMRMAEVLLHELFHCIFAVWNIDDDDKEERTVMAMALGLSTVWRDNPDVFEYIDYCLTAKNVG